MTQLGLVRISGSTHQQNYSILSQVSIELGDHSQVCHFNIRGDQFDYFQTNTVLITFN